jgi:3-hydroxyisobutyrate dehydrogenase-like beta-hydroxyacid dehydrogenase
MAEPLELAGPVGFIGLGIMGSAMSTHLLEAGHRVIGYDVSPAACDAHRARGGTVAGSPAEIAARTSLVVTSLPSAGALTKVLRGLAARAALGLTVIETSTLAPEDKEAERQFLADRQAWLLDCPVSGTGAQARDKDLVAYLSGDEAAKARAWPVLAGMTREIYDAGEFGNGTKLKLVANLLVAVHNVAAAEALVLAERADLDLATVLAAVGDGAGTSRMFEVRGPAMAAQDYAGPGVAATVFGKDIAIITGFASQLRSPTPLFSLASAYYQAALAQGHGADDTSSVHAVLRALAPLPPPPG